MRLGIDLGGTKIEAALLDRDGAIVRRERVPTPRGDYAETIATIATLVTAVGGEAPRDLPVGIGIPGTISPATGLIKNANSTWLIGKAFDKDLKAALGREVRLANDADCFALSEAADGAAAHARSVFGVILGTGVGGGLVINGALHGGPNAIAGEWGHNPLPWPTEEEYDGPDCYCGKRGCIETWLSGPALERNAARHGIGNERALDIAAKAQSGDQAARNVLDDYCDRLARALAGVINIVDPEVIVLGGGLSAIDRLYEDVPALLPRYVFSDTVETRLVRNVHGDSSGVRGAAWLWPEMEKAPDA
ncbi:MAG: ROK family protein [Parvibaculaceae bacterium]